MDDRAHVSSPSSNGRGYPSLSHVVLHDHHSGTSLFPQVEFVFEDDEIPLSLDDAVCVELDASGKVTEVTSAHPTIKIANFRVLNESDGSETLHIEGAFAVHPYEPTKSFSKTVRDLFEELEVRNKFICSLLLDETKPGGLLPGELSESLKIQNSFSSILSSNEFKPRSRSAGASQMRKQQQLHQEKEKAQRVNSLRGSASPEAVIPVSLDDESEDFSITSSLESEHLKDMVLQFHRKQSISPPSDEPFQPILSSTPRRGSIPTPPFEDAGDGIADLMYPSSPTLTTGRSMPKVCLSPYKDCASGVKSPTPRARAAGFPHIIRNLDSSPPPLPHYKAARTLSLDILPPSSPPPTTTTPATAQGGTAHPATLSAATSKQNPSVTQRQRPLIVEKKQHLDEQVMHWLDKQPESIGLSAKDEDDPTYSPPSPVSMVPFPQIISHGHRLTQQPTRAQSTPSFSARPVLLPSFPAQENPLGLEESDNTHNRKQEQRAKVRPNNNF